MVIFRRIDPILPLVDPNPPVPDKKEDKSIADCGSNLISSSIICLG